jgi:hypothetical protein
MIGWPAGANGDAAPAAADEAPDCPTTDLPMVLAEVKSPAEVLSFHTALAISVAVGPETGAAASAAGCAVAGRSP